MSNRQRVFSFNHEPRTSEPVIIRLGDVGIGATREIDGFKLLGYVASLSSGGSDSARGLHDFLEDVILEEDMELWKRTVAEQNLTIEDLSTIAAWLLEVYTTRPTKPSSEFSDGQSENGSGSTENYSSEALTGVVSPLTDSSEFSQRSGKKNTQRAKKLSSSG
jgi:hypothetical protein